MGQCTYPGCGESAAPNSNRCGLHPPSGSQSDKFAGGGLGSLGTLGTGGHGAGQGYGSGAPSSPQVAAPLYAPAAPPMIERRKVAWMWTAAGVVIALIVLYVVMRLFP